MKSNLNVNISLPQSEFAILKKLAKALGWNLFVQQQERSIDIKERKKIIEELYA